MPRSLWTGSISFGLVNIPVRLSTAVRDKTISFNMLSPDGGCRLRRKLFCPETGEEYDFKDTARGYAIAPDQYVIIRDEELDSLKPDAGRTIDISDFIDLEQIDPIYFDRSYYLLPGEGGAKAYRLLMQAMEQSGRVAIAQFVMRQKQYLVAIRPIGGALMLHTVHYADEVTEAVELNDELPDAEVDDRELKVAKQLIEALHADFEPEKYKDEYREQVRELIESKAEGEDITTASTGEAEAAPPTFNLMDALKASLEDKGPASKKKSGKRKKAG
jgi:DNA end-binding protein Ku